MYWELTENRDNILFTLHPQGLAQYLMGNKYLWPEVLALIGHSFTYWCIGFYICNFITECLLYAWLCSGG